MKRNFRDLIAMGFDGEKAYYYDKIGQKMYTGEPAGSVGTKTTFLSGSNILLVVILNRTVHLEGWGILALASLGVLIATQYTYIQLYKEDVEVTDFNVTSEFLKTERKNLLQLAGFQLAFILSTILSAYLYLTIPMLVFLICYGGMLFIVLLMFKHNIIKRAFLYRDIAKNVKE